MSSPGGTIGLGGLGSFRSRGVEDVIGRTLALRDARDSKGRVVARSSMPLKPVDEGAKGAV